MLVLCGVFAVWLLIVTPILNAKAQALRQKDIAANNYQIVKNGVTYLGAGESQAKKPMDQTEFVQEARKAGMALTRIQPETDGALRVWFEPVIATKVYTFLQTLSQNYAVSLTQIQIDQTEGGLVDVQMTLSPGQ